MLRPPPFVQPKPPLAGSWPTATLAPGQSLQMATNRVIAGERNRPGCRFRRRALPSAVRRGIFVEPKLKPSPGLRPAEPRPGISPIRWARDISPGGAAQTFNAKTQRREESFENPHFAPLHLCVNSVHLDVAPGPGQCGGLRRPQQLDAVQFADGRLNFDRVGPHNRSGLKPAPGHFFVPALFLFSSGMMS